MLKYVLLLALVSMSLCQDGGNQCPSGATDESMQAACQTELNAFMTAAIAGDADVLADAQAMDDMENSGCSPGCAGMDCVLGLFKGKETKAFFECFAEQCGCAGSIYKFGFAMLFAMIAYWFK